MLRKNINGSNYAQMREDVLSAYEPLYLVTEKLAKLHPHPRDYQLNPEDYSADEREHRDQLEKLHGVLRYLASLYAALEGGAA